MNCRHCGDRLKHQFLDLGFAPPSNAYLDTEKLNRPELYYPLRLMVCDHCWLVQTEDYARAEDIFSNDYAYFSSTSTSWLAHAAEYASSAIDRLGLTKNSFVIEVASNDGYLLRNFVSSDIPCLGIEPTASTAAAAEEIGVPVLRAFFSEHLGKQLVAQGKQADLVIGNNVYAHVPDINDFTRGLKAALKHGGTITLEFPHLMQLLVHAQFDTVYHEHFSYLSLCTVARLFEASGLRLWDVEQLSTHGGSLRVYGCHADDKRQTSQAVAELMNMEKQRGIQDIATYNGFQARADKIKNDMLSFLIHEKRAGKKFAAYGAAAKGNTFINYAGIKRDLVPFVCDASPAKQGKFMPGSHIPILPPSVLAEYRPDYLWILPWNIAREIRQQHAGLAVSGTRFVTAVPRLEIV